MPADICKNLTNLKERIEAAAERAGRNSHEVRLVAVSKTVSSAVVEEAYGCGLRVFGENRVQEMVAKALALPADCDWHLIGHLQKNKVRDAVKTADFIHSLDSISLAERISKIAVEENKCQKVLLQVNVSHEETKFGTTVAGTEELLAKVLELPHLDCKGLMTMAPFNADDKSLRHIFGELRCLRDRLNTAFRANLTELSMGMSGDFEIAIEEGATMIRVGTAIFGERT